MSKKLSEDTKKALLAMTGHLVSLRNSGISHADIVVEQVRALVEMPHATEYLESVYAALATATEAIQQKPISAAWHIGCVIRDLERLISNLQQQRPDKNTSPAS